MESSNKTKKIGLKSITWLGFGYTCSGITFTTAFAGLISSSETGIGYWIFLVILIVPIFLLGISRSYGKCATIFNKSNGGAYLYVRSMYGRFWGWIVGAIQYIVLPSALISLIVSLVDQNIGFLIPSSVRIIGSGQRWQHVILNTIGIIIFVVVSLIIKFGAKGLKVTITVSSILQWVSSAIVIFCAIYLFAKSGKNNLQPSEYSNKFNFFNFNSAALKFIFFYTGFESYATMTKNMKNPKKDLGKALLIIMGITFLFYTIVTFVFIGALGIDNFENNSGIGKPGNIPSIAITKKVLSTMGVIIIVISIIMTRINAISQNSLYSGTTIEPLAVEGYVSNKLAKLQKDNIPFNASIANTFFTAFLAFVMVILPSIITKNTIDFSVAIGYASLFIALVYILVLLATYKLYALKKIKLHFWELLLMTMSFIFLLWLVIFYFIDLFKSIYKNTNLVVNIVQLCTVIGFVVFIILWYYIYYDPKYKKRLLEHPEIQKELEKNFTLLIK